MSTPESQPQTPQYRIIEQPRYFPVNFPTIVCLCGSTRYYDAFQRANFAETMAGRIVLTVGFYPHSAGQAHGEWIGITPEEKEDLDRLHLRKIDLADECLFLNADDYIGVSTRRELAYARSLGKRIRWLGRSVHALPGEVIDER